MTLQADSPQVKRATFWMVVLVGVATVAIVTLTEPRFEKLPRLLDEPGQLSGAIQKWRYERRHWRPAEILSLVLPIFVLPTLAVVFHKLDWKYGGGGIKDRVDWLRRPHSRLEPDVIAGTMTKQSILAAIAAIFLSSTNVGRMNSLKFSEFATAVATLGFSAALLLLIVSALSYDYANRFRLAEEERYELARKGLRLDIFAWYVLVASYITSMAARLVLTSIAVSVGTAFLVRWYYFVSPRTLGSIPKRRPIRLGILWRERQFPMSLRRGLAALAGRVRRVSSTG